MTHPLTQNIPRNSTSHIHSLGDTLILSLANLSSYSVSRTCSQSQSPTNSHVLSLNIPYLRDILPLTDPFIYTHKSSLNVSVSQSHPGWSHGHSHPRKNVWVDVYMFYHDNMSSTNTSHPWCVPDSISCVESHCLYLVTRIAFAPSLWWNELKWRTNINKDWSLYTVVAERYKIQICCPMLLQLHLIMIWCSTWRYPVHFLWSKSYIITVYDCTKYLVYEKVIIE